jgi:trigger factor
VKVPEIEITDQMLDDEIVRQRKIRGRFEPVTEGAAERDDMIVADVAVHAGDRLIKTEDNIQLGVRPSTVDGIQLEQLDTQLAGVKPGETRTVDCQFPDDYERADVRGQSGRIEFKVHELKRLAPLLLDDFLQRSGFDQEQEARDYFRMMMENERDQMVSRAKHEQVNEYLLEKTSLDLPEQLSARQADRAIARRVIELRQRGVPESDISARIDELRTSAREQAVRDLKLSFILDKVAEQLEVQVTDEEVNTQIALMARRYNRRFDRVRDELQQQGLLSQLAEQIRQDKCVTRILEDANIVGTTAEEGGEK